VGIAKTLRDVTCTHWFRVGTASVVAAGVLTALYALAGHSHISITLQSALVHAAGMTTLVSLTVPRLRPAMEGRPAAMRWTVTIALLLTLALVGTALACGVITLLGLRPNEPFALCYRHDFSICVLITLTLGISMGLYDTQRRRLDAVTAALRDRELDHERARKTMLEARLASLEARLQPHFMFNTLNAISALIQEDPQEAERTVERLAALLRFSLDATERGLVPLEHELKIVTDYLEIERTRFAERLAYTIDVQPEAAGVEVPPLAIQTLAENSIKHAIAPRPSGGHVRIAASAVGERVVLSVWDDGRGFAADAMRPGHGLDNLRGRLAARFGDRASLEVGRRDGGTVVTVSLPRAAMP
jgi:two-component system, LytTR family, sensor histidine kinase AlgZ